MPAIIPHNQPWSWIKVTLLLSYLFSISNSTWRGKTHTCFT